MASPAPSRNVWLPDAIEARTSKIAGSGLFATENIAADTVVMRFGGRVVSTVELNALFAEADRRGGYVDTITVDQDHHLVMPDGSLAHFANHSCDPTMWHVGAFEVAIRRPVDADEELTIDYATNSGDATFTMECTCGAMLCRGTITAQDWRQPELQERYDGHWIPALAALIGSSR